MIFRNELEKVGLEDLGFTLGNVVDVSGVDLMRSTEEGLPACDGIGANDWAG